MVAGPPPAGPTRWTLKGIRQWCKLLALYTLSGIWRRLNRAGLRYKRGRDYVHSPDPDYVARRDQAQWCVIQARNHPGQIITLYQDELTYYRHPSLASTWTPAGAAHQAYATRSHKSTTKARIGAVLDVVSGKVCFHRGDRFGVKALRRLYKTIRQTWPDATIYLIQDNWPVHFLPDVMAAAAEHNIEIVPLPTYAPWLNPIEKLWRWLKQDIIHLHRHSAEWAELHRRVEGFLHRFDNGSNELLRYVGLLPI